MDSSWDEAKNRLVFALDVPDAAEAARYVRELDGCVGCFKVGLELFVREGPEVLKEIRRHSRADIFLDLKLHDIPATVQGALRAAVTLGASYITVHAGDGPSLLSFAGQARQQGLEVLAVTVLTHLNEKDLAALGYREGLGLHQLVLDRAAVAREAGCAGVVCAGEEIETVRERCGPEMKIVVPGIRPEWSSISKDDQRRVTPPRQAIERGADLLVVGRPIRDAKDPRDAARQVLEEIQDALPKRS